MREIALINHGCAKNLVDSELMLGKLAQAGYRITLDETKADIVIINTCSFIHDAEKESVKSIFDMIEAGKKIIIAGCLSQKYKKELQELIPEALAFIGTSDLDKIVDVVKDITKNKKVRYDVNEKPVYDYPEDIKRQQITMGASSYIKIADGCDFNCGYCIIPKLRGPYKSRKIE
ncbi:30S ribosomal protein S12 methylthiotransferase RimO, partial [bacterium]|nr:30S ribosomal protein S12 methylthiotransferase RimO [bacterium]